MSEVRPTPLAYESIDEAKPPPAFCYDCVAATSDESAGNTVTVNFIGTGLFGSAEPCPLCGSAVSTKWVTFFFPVIPLQSYRVIELPRNQYLSRSMRRIDWRQVLRTYAFWIGVIAVGVAVVKLSRWWAGDPGSSEL
jgi:hypothetical protein